MQKLSIFALVLIVAGAASAGSVSLKAISGPGTEGEPLSPSDSITIIVTTDTSLVAIDVVLTVTSGDGSITGAMGIADSGSWGWDTILGLDPIITATSAEIGAGAFSGSGAGDVGYFVVHCDGLTDVVVTLSAGTNLGGSWDIDIDAPTISGTLTIHQVPEPMTIALLGLGAVMLRRKR